MLVSGVQQSDSVLYIYIYIYIYIFFFRFFSLIGFYKIMRYGVVSFLDRKDLYGK